MIPGQTRRLKFVLFSLLQYIVCNFTPSFILYNIYIQGSARPSILMPLPSRTLHMTLALICKSFDDRRRRRRILHDQPLLIFELTKKNPQTSLLSLISTTDY